jgi:pimeloyl-ACP methyl ester carboxylesterase
VRAVSAPFGNLSDAQWESLSRSVARQTPDGGWRLKYDPGIAVPFRATASKAMNLWPVWDAIHCPTLLLRGAESDLLSRATAKAMQERGPRPDLIEFAGIGHAPMMLSTDQIEPVVRFLGAD